MVSKSTLFVTTKNTCKNSTKEQHLDSSACKRGKILVQREKDDNIAFYYLIELCEDLDIPDDGEV